MTTTEPKWAHPLDPDIDTTVPAWLNVDVIFPPELNLRERVTEIVLEGSRVLEQLHDFLSRAIALDNLVESCTWPAGAPDDFGEFTRPMIGADALRDLMLALAGLADEGSQGVPTHQMLIRCLDRFGLDPIREYDEHGRRTDIFGGGDR